MQGLNEERCGHQQRLENALPPVQTVRKLYLRMRSILLVSLVLNVALAIALAMWLASAPNYAPRVVRAPDPALINSNSLPLRIIKTNLLIRPRTFTWQEVESPDYAVYVENLRELGMPATTIRDIIVADIDQLFTKRKRDEEARQDLEWWRSTPSYEMQSNALARVQIIEAERNALLTKLLGENWDKGRTEQQRTPVVLAGPVLGSLPDDVKASVQDVASRSRDRVNAYLAEKESKGEQVSVAELAKIREETRQQFAAILNPQQLEEFLLRYSETANRLRKELTGFSPTPDEFRSIFRVVDQIDREIQLRYSGDDLASQRARQNLEQQRLAAIRTVVGAERFATYQASQDPAYQDALAAALKAGGNEQTARALYEIQKATTDELNRIRNDNTLTDAQKQQQLRSAGLEQEKARAIVLGEPLPPPDTAAANPPPAVPQLQQHVMAPFETLGLLSIRYGVGLSALREANPGVDINRLRPGTVINIPQAPTQPPFPLPPGVQAR